MDTIMMFAFPVTILVAGMAGGLLTKNEIPRWYKTINKSKLNPPNWIFGPMWSLLYTLIGISGYLVWSKNKSFSGNDVAWCVYFVQLALNLAWTPLFFYLHYLFASLVEILALAFTILINILLFYSIEPTAGLLLVPYLLWVSFASFLTFDIWRLNPSSGEKKN